MADIIVISGASRGIGLELTKQALEKGLTVVAGSRKPEDSKGLKELAAKYKDKLKSYPLDIASDASVNAFAAKLKADGISHIDILFNNAGIYMKEDGHAMKVSPDVVAKTLETNAIGPIRLTHALLPLVKVAKHPRIANTSSLMGSIADNSSGGALGYRMSKAALNMFVKNLANDEKTITSVTLHPGWVKTDMGGDQAPIEPAQSAAGLLKICLEAKPAQSGKFYNFDGKELPW